MASRRQFLRGAGLMAAGASVGRSALAALPEAPSMDKPATQPPLAPPSGRPYNPVVTLNGWTLPWRMNNGVKEFHLVAEPVVRELAPGMKADSPTGFTRIPPQVGEIVGRVTRQKCGRCCTT